MVWCIVYMLALAVRVAFRGMYIELGNHMKEWLLMETDVYVGQLCFATSYALHAPHMLSHASAGAGKTRIL